MARYFLHLSYKGTRYHGWQIQPNAHTIQAEIQNGLSTILREEISIMGSGRTDTGVHAKVQVAHFDYDKPLVSEELVYKLNSILPNDIAINACRPVEGDAHTRFDAVERGYHYFIHTKKSPFLISDSYYFSQALDLGLMNLAAEKLVGEQDFESFSKVKTEVNNFICNISHANWFIENDQLVFHVRANRFLRGMVRALVGTLLLVGENKLSVEDFVQVIKSKDRQKAGRAVPPHGLFLTAVNYPKDIYL
ncbi:tRNA pseudouridine(38-40) synthase TruA [Roseivirga misakiensis]|uniref:tRNA pseudouridine synthase A n=1 Tax=Roseivirga misakiensis TaxID=1563681 RepID=A0A1E5T768_9BACT|nr:tRNA pseudouridine(38-40) synthase TruA [Roseivirga misakiensis]OEK07210.1 tRNA pseudouridine(38-40) synthase TruA [Roseivirga misakiensis]